MGGLFSSSPPPHVRKRQKQSSSSFRRRHKAATAPKRKREQKEETKQDPPPQLISQKDIALTFLFHEGGGTLHVIKDLLKEGSQKDFEAYRQWTVRSQPADTPEQKKAIAQFERDTIMVANTILDEAHKVNKTQEQKNIDTWSLDLVTEAQKDIIMNFEEEEEEDDQEVRLALLTRLNLPFLNELKRKKTTGLIGSITSYAQVLHIWSHYFWDPDWTLLSYVGERVMEAKDDKGLIYPRIQALLNKAVQHGDIRILDFIYFSFSTPLFRGLIYRMGKEEEGKTREELIRMWEPLEEYTIVIPSMLKTALRAKAYTSLYWMETHFTEYFAWMDSILESTDEPLPLFPDENLHILESALIGGDVYLVEWCWQIFRYPLEQVRDTALQVNEVLLPMVRAKYAGMFLYVDQITKGMKRFLNLRDKFTLLDTAIQTGDVETFRVVFAAVRDFDMETDAKTLTQLFTSTLQAGNVDVLHELEQPIGRQHFNSDLLNAAEIKDIFHVASRQGYVNMLDEMERRFEFTARNSLDAKSKFYGFLTKGWDGAVEHNRPQVLQFLYDRYLHPTRRTGTGSLLPSATKRRAYLLEIAKRGFLAVFNWFQTVGARDNYPLAFSLADLRRNNSQVLRVAAAYGHALLLKQWKEIFLGLERRDVQAANNEALRMAIQNCHPRVLHTLYFTYGLRKEDALVNGGEALHIANKNDCADTLKILYDGYGVRKEDALRAKVQPNSRYPHAFAVLCDPRRYNLCDPYRLASQESKDVKEKALQQERTRKQNLVRLLQQGYETIFWQRYEHKDADKRWTLKDVQADDARLLRVAKDFERKPTVLRFLVMLGDVEALQEMREKKQVTRFELERDHRILLFLARRIGGATKRRMMLEWLTTTFQYGVHYLVQEGDVETLQTLLDKGVLHASRLRRKRRVLDYLARHIEDEAKRNIMLAWLGSHVGVI